jgi:hypothetical protein
MWNYRLVRQSNQRPAKCQSPTLPVGLLARNIMSAIANIRQECWNDCRILSTNLRARSCNQDFTRFNTTGSEEYDDPAEFVGHPFKGEGGGLMHRVWQSPLFTPTYSKFHQKEPGRPFLPQFTLFTPLYHFYPSLPFLPLFTLVYTKMHLRVSFYPICVISVFKSFDINYYFWFLDIFWVLILPTTAI